MVSIPLVTLLVLRLTASPRVMGRYRNGWLSNLALALTAGLALLLAYKLADEVAQTWAGGRR